MSTRVGARQGVTHFTGVLLKSLIICHYQSRMLYLILFALLEYVVLSNSHSLHDELHSLQVDITIFSQIPLKEKKRRKKKKAPFSRHYSLRL